MSELKGIQSEIHEGTTLVAPPATETNYESRHHLAKPCDHGLQAEQFIACPQKPQSVTIPAFAARKKSENMRDATMSHYNLLNASDHV